MRSKIAVAALAGRRIDTPHSSKIRFPEFQSELVASTLKNRFKLDKVDVLICSAACGSDIIALETALSLSIPIKIILPFGEDKFRITSVIDRPGNWGKRFDNLIIKAKKNFGLIDLNLDPEDPKTFKLANEFILDTALGFNAIKNLAYIVWEGEPRGADDVTEDFRQRAISNKFEIITVNTKNALK